MTHFMESLHEMYALVAHSTKLLNERQEENIASVPVPDFDIEGIVLLHNHTPSVWDPKYDPAIILCILFQIGMLR